ncbi:MAG TPA: glycosyltransferase [Candidatus Rifleibacterium sp.]|nr:glycosyltransferase [Candidatus Rifleibacterium sp.]HPT47061.1 glycosyltransferase [Candidatus Rifleibacterium sp.]
MKVSVIIPVYNAEATIGKTLHALLRQNKADFLLEIITVDDGSTDATPTILQGFQGIKVIRQMNAGPASARNTGARAATGDILAFTDSDTIPHPEWLDELIQPFSTASIMATAGTYTIANPGNRLAEVIQKEITWRHARYGEFIEFGGTYNLAVRKELFERIGGFNETFRRASGEDNDFCYRILRQGHRIKYVPTAKVAHYHPEKFLKYLREQFRHGFWRAKLYMEHPVHLSGDSYTGKKDIFETLCCLGLFLSFCVSLLNRGASFQKRWPQLSWFPSSLSWLALLVAIETRVAIEQANTVKHFFHTSLIFSTRAIARSAGFISGMLCFGLRTTNIQNKNRLLSVAKK